MTGHLGIGDKVGILALTGPYLSSKVKETKVETTVLLTASSVTVSRYHGFSSMA